jgi:hypothetical protein
MSTSKSLYSGCLFLICIIGLADTRIIVQQARGGVARDVWVGHVSDVRGLVL